jgi:membrane protein required for colicin V production
MEKLASMNFDYFDLGIISIILILSIKGFLQGFIKEFFGLLGLLGGLYFALKYSDEVSKIISQNLVALDDKSLLSMLGFLSILIGMWIFSILVGTIISKLAYFSGLGFFNRLLGFIVGGGKYFVIFSLIIGAFANVKFVQDNLKKFTSKSMVYPYLLETGSYLLNLDKSFLTSIVDKKDKISK